ncbi:hypothetical protein BKA56DRAFT_619201 [Ilyonectria sp. MPI-CAGE-AT-0026]|nr:hypothetical protein BKA56DRAFT_619201 [Ilyonectria sp. MPI-CAGE-AT-0026]
MSMWHGSWPHGSIWIQLVTRWFHPRLRAEKHTAEDGLPFQDSGSSGGRPERSGSQGQRAAGLVWLLKCANRGHFGDVHKHHVANLFWPLAPCTFCGSSDTGPGSPTLFLGLRRQLRVASGPTCNHPYWRWRRDRQRIDPTRSLSTWVMFNRVTHKSKRRPLPGPILCV